MRQANFWMNQTRIIISLLLTTAMLIGLTGLMIACQPAPITTGKTIHLTILHTNDTHAHLDNIACRATKIDQIRNEVGDDNLLLLDAGDVFHGTPYFTLYQGQADLWFMNHMGYDAMCLGNHEFDKGSEVLASFANEADFPVLCTNFDFSNESRLTGEIVPWVIIEKGGEQYGIFGLTTEETAEISSPGENVVINSHIDTASEVVASLESEGVNKIIALTHLGWESDVKLAQEVDGIDIIVGGYSHTVPDTYPTIVAEGDRPTLIVQAGEYGEYLGRLDVRFNEDGVIQGWEGSQLIPVDENIEEDVTCAARLAEYSAPIQELMNTVIARTLVDLDGERDHVRAQETNLSDLIADAMLEKARCTSVTIAILNGGGIRASIPAGDVTLGQIMTVLDFGNYLVAIDLTGEQVTAALENGVSQVEQVKERFPQVAGLRFTWDPDAEVGSRILSVEVITPDGYQSIESSSTYRVVTNNFLYQGGDGYTVFQEGTNFVNLGFIDYEVLAEYVKANSPLSPQIEGRIQKKLRVMAVFHTSIEEPWNSCIHRALLRAEKEMEIDYHYTDEVSSEDLDQVLRDYAGGGYDVIFGDAFLSEEVVRDVARDYPGVYFIFGSSLGPVEPNLAVFDNWIHEPAYLCGMIAGKLTKSGVIGVVGGYPIAEVNRLINAYRAGVEEVNHDIRVKVAFIDSWFDPPRAREEALAQIESGVDVIYAERCGVIEAAQDKGILAFGNLIDQNELAPSTVITGPIWDMWPLLSHVLTSISRGSFRAVDCREWSMMAKGGAYLASFHGFEETLPKEVLDMVQKRKQEILDEEFTVQINEAVPPSD